jgi:hypothetical protein
MRGNLAKSAGTRSARMRPSLGLFVLVFSALRGACFRFGYNTLFGFLGSVAIRLDYDLLAAVHPSIDQGPCP